MAETKTLTLDQFKNKVAAAAPEFAQALRDEETYRRFCRKVRDDLKQLREGMGMKQSDVASVLQMSQPGVSKIENGDGDIGLLSICRYAAALGMQPTLTFAPAAATYAEPEQLTTAVRAMEKLSETRLATAESSAHDRYRELAAFFAASAGPQVPDSVIVGAVASAMSSAVTQSLSTEIASMVSAFSELNREESAEAESAPEEKPDVAAT